MKSPHLRVASLLILLLAVACTEAEQTAGAIATAAGGDTAAAGDTGGPGETSDDSAAGDSAVGGEPDGIGATGDGAGNKVSLCSGIWSSGAFAALAVGDKDRVHLVAVDGGHKTVMLPLDDAPGKPQFESRVSARAPYVLAVTSWTNSADVAKDALSKGTVLTLMKDSGVVLWQRTQQKFIAEESWIGDNGAVTVAGRWTDQQQGGLWVTSVELGPPVLGQTKKHRPVGPPIVSPTTNSTYIPVKTVTDKGSIYGWLDIGTDALTPFEIGLGYKVILFDHYLLTLGPGKTTPWLWFLGAGESKAQFGPVWFDDGKDLDVLAHRSNGSVLWILVGSTSDWSVLWRIKFAKKTRKNGNIYYDSEVEKQEIELPAGYSEFNDCETTKPSLDMYGRVLLPLRNDSAAQVFRHSFGKLKGDLVAVGAPMNKIETVGVVGYYGTFFIESGPSQTATCSALSLDNTSAQTLVGANVQVVTLIDDKPINFPLAPNHEYTANRWGMCVVHYTKKADGAAALSIYDAQKATDFALYITGSAAWIQQ